MVKDTVKPNQVEYAQESECEHSEGEEEGSTPDCTQSFEQTGNNQVNNVDKSDGPGADEYDNTEPHVSL